MTAGVGEDERNGQDDKRDEGTASEKDPDPTEKGKSGDDSNDQAEADEEAKESFPGSDAPSW